MRNKEMLLKDISGLGALVSCCILPVHMIGCWGSVDHVNIATQLSGAAYCIWRVGWRRNNGLIHGRYVWVASFP